VSDCSVGKFESQVGKKGTQVGKFDGQVGKFELQVGIEIFQVWERRCHPQKRLLAQLKAVTKVSNDRVSNILMIQADIAKI
jgi:hypothetical protein